MYPACNHRFPGALAPSEWLPVGSRFSGIGADGVGPVDWSSREHLCGWVPTDDLMWELDCRADLVYAEVVEERNREEMARYANSGPESD